MRCGIEFEYLIVDTAGPSAGRVRDFVNLSLGEIAPILDDKPGRDDKTLATGDLGIKSGYWYLEGDERFHDDGRFRTLEVKGVEIRTPPADDVAGAIARLVDIETQLADRLARHGLGLAIAGFNPSRPAYDFDPPLNDWEAAMRNTYHQYDAPQVSNLSFGPDINLSMPGWTPVECVDAARKLNHYAPFIVPFSFCSPFFAGEIWSGWSKRTYERAPRRPAVKLFTPFISAPASRLVHPPRHPGETGRIEFKAFDAMPGLDVLAACCHLLEGVCLAEDLPGRSEQTDWPQYRRAAQDGFDNPAVHRDATEVLDKARAALEHAGRHDAVQALVPLERMLDARRTPAHDLLDRYRAGGPMYSPGGYAAHAGVHHA